MKDRDTGLKGSDVILFAFVMAIIYWISESLMHVFVFLEGDLLQQIFRPEIHEAWMRFVGVIIIIMFGIFAQSMINRQRQTQRAIEDLNEKNQLILESAGEGIFGLDTDGRVTFVNPAGAKMLGYSVEELVGEIHHNKVHHSRPDGTPYPIEACPIHETYKKGVFHKGDDEIFWKKDGTSIPIEYKSSPIIEKRGVLKGAVVSFSDITERKKAENEIRSLKQQMEFILGATRTGLDIIDSSLNIVYIDPEWQKVYGDPADKKCYEYFMGRSEVCPDCGVLKALEAKNITVSEEVLVKEGNRPIHVTTIPFQNEKGEWLVAEVNVDITDRKRAEEALRKAHDELEMRVQERTSELWDINKMLQAEVTVRQMTEDTLRENETYLKAIMDSIHAGVIVIDAETHEIVDVNRKALEMMGISKDEMIGKICHKYICPAEKGNCPITDLRQAIDNSERFIIDSSGRSIPVLKTVIPIKLKGRDYLLESFIDIAVRKQLEEELRAMSLHDELTGMYNRRGFLTLVEQQMKLANRTNEAMLLVFADLDGLKDINDTLGHKQGDRALIDVADILTDTFRKSDIIARMGGDEFVVLALCANKMSAGIINARLKNWIEEFNSKGGRPYKLSLSIGIVCYDPEKPASIDELLIQADKLMYEQKQMKKKSNEI
ncbi:MAG: diguanylate cyclase [Nitrospirota bacterium]